jgi:hypothetical protein
MGKYDALRTKVDALRAIHSQKAADEASARVNTLAAADIALRDSLAAEDNAKCEAQEKADSVLGHYGVRAPSPVASESTRSYRRRLSVYVQARLPPSHELRSIDLVNTRADDVFGAWEKQVYDEAERLHNDSSSVPAGQLVERDATSPGGPVIKEFYGEHFVKGLTRPGRKVKRLIAADSRTGTRTVLIGPPEDRLN